ncbi:MAG: hypothetical protein D6812_16395, partial [Deltaproteobacteria bacterium]
MPLARCEKRFPLPPKWEIPYAPLGGFVMTPFPLCFSSLRFLRSIPPSNLHVDGGCPYAPPRSFRLSSPHSPHDSATVAGGNRGCPLRFLLH